MKKSRAAFKVTTAGVTVDPVLPNFATPSAEGVADNVYDQFARLLDSTKYSFDAFIQKHSQLVDRFISAVAQGINKKPEELVLDQYQPFIELLRKWASNYKASKNIPKSKIRLGDRMLLKAGEEEESDTDEFSEFANSSPVSLSEFKTALLAANPALTESEVTKNDIYLNYLRYYMTKVKNPLRSTEEIIKDMGLMVGLFQVFVDANGNPFDLEKFFEGGGVRVMKLSPRIAPVPAAPASPVVVQAPPAPSPAQYSPALLEIMKELLDEAPDGFTASHLVDEYEYVILPKRYSNSFFGPDLIYGIGQAMQRLREKYKFTRTNDELFVEFINDEHWRDLFVSLVVGVITLQKKISSFSTPQNVVRMIENNVELTVAKFSTFTKFHRQAQPKRQFNF
jgi:hypothetical protein